MTTPTTIQNGIITPQAQGVAQDALQAPSLSPPSLSYTEVLEIPTFRDEALESYLPGGDNNDKKHYGGLPTNQNHQVKLRDTRVSVEVHDSVVMEELLSDIMMDPVGVEENIGDDSSSSEMNFHLSR